MLALIATLIGSLTAAPAPQDRRSPQTDETVAVARGTRLSIENFAGEIVVRAWDRDSLRVQARHSARGRVNVRTAASVVRVSSSGDRGPVGSVDYEITAPAWMPIKIDGQYNFVTVEGTQAEVSVDTQRGDVIVKGGNGVTIRSVQGNIAVEGARGRINLSSVNEGITLNGASGEITVETVNGPIALSGIDAANVEGSTINGNVTFEGTPAAGGRYRFTTHNGNITIGVPESANATFTVRTYNGGFNSNLPVKGEGNVRSGRRVSYTLGSGAAEFELESFAGSIRLRKPGTMPAAAVKDK
jgi:DUF4097 and DUF4098 domain-containing protein YvlB